MAWTCRRLVREYKAGRLPGLAAEIERLHSTPAHQFLDNLPPSAHYATGNSEECPAFELLYQYLRKANKVVTFAVLMSIILLRIRSAPRWLLHKPRRRQRSPSNTRSR